MIKTKTYITVKNQFIGFHSWPDAPKEVGWLASTHRHLFKIETTLEVEHDDRDCEFFIVQNLIYQYLINSVGPDLGKRSCEMLAKQILEHCAVVLEYKVKSVKVMEDDENFATVEVV